MSSTLVLFFCWNKLDGYWLISVILCYAIIFANGNELLFWNNDKKNISSFSIAGYPIFYFISSVCHILFFYFTSFWIFFYSINIILHYFHPFFLHFFLLLLRPLSEAEEDLVLMCIDVLQGNQLDLIKSRRSVLSSKSTLHLHLLN